MTSPAEISNNDASDFFDFDVLVIGSGPAGQRAALQGAKAGRRVAVIEEYVAVGGGCVHFGTVPSKSLRESVYRYSLGSRGILGQENEHVYRVSKPALPEMPRLMRRKERVISGESQVIFDQLKRNRVEIISGRARLAGAHEVEILNEGKKPRKVTARFIFIAVGARPVAPAHIPVDGKIIHDSNTLLKLKKTPRSVVVLGAGIIGCEYASIFSTAGVKVSLVDRRSEILASVDREIVAHLAERFSFQGMQIVLSAEATRIETFFGRGRTRAGKPIGARVHLSNGKKINAEMVLVALGRAGNTQDLGLEKVGVQADERGLIRVNEHFQTSIPSIYAVGDVIGAPALASTSMEQGRIACCHALGIAGSHQMPALFPYGIYTIPEISMIGKTEEELAASGADFVVGRSSYKELARGQIVGDRWGLLKLMVDRQSLRLLGVHIIGDNAADLIHIGQAVMALGGDVNYFISSVFNYPTLAEAYKTAAFNAVNQLLGASSGK